MKTTYLMNKAQADGSVQLSVTDREEWQAVVKANKQIPAEKRRYFILDYIKDGADLDCMIIEAPVDVYRTWIREHMASKRNRDAGKAYQHFSVDAPVTDSDGVETLLDTISAMLIESDARVFNLAVALVRPRFPPLKFLRAVKVLKSEPDQHSHRIYVDDGLRVQLIQSIVALGVKHCVLPPFRS